MPHAVAPSHAPHTPRPRRLQASQDDNEEDAFAAAAAALPAGGVAAAAVSTSNAANPLALFNAKFRAACEEKDAKEREAKSARRAAGKAALKGILADRGALVDARKAKNREDEAAKEREAMDALEGESWGRVVSLVDVHALHVPVTATDKKKPVDAPEPDMGRQKDLLISLKSSPLPAATAAH